MARPISGPWSVRAKALESLLRTDVVGRFRELLLLIFSPPDVALFLLCNF